MRAYPSPYGVNGAHVLGYLSPITEGELDEAEQDDDRSVNGASVVGRAGVEKAYDTWLRGQPGYKKVAVDSMGRVLGDSGEVESTPGDTLVTSIDSDVQAFVEKQLHTDHPDRSCHHRHRHRAEVRRGQWRSGRARRQDRSGGRDGEPADVRPGGLVGRHHRQAAEAALLRRGRHAAALAGHPGTVRARLHVEADDDRGRPGERLQHRYDARLLVRLPGRQPGVQELRVGCLRRHRVHEGARGLLQHLLLPGRPPLLAEVRHRRRRRQRQGPVGPHGPEVRLRQEDRHRHPRRGHRTHRRPEVEARLLQVHEELLLQGREARRQRLPAPFREGVLRRGVRLPRR